MAEFEGKLVADKYRVGELIREGSTGDIYSGIHEITGDPVLMALLPQALSMDPRLAEPFTRNARRFAGISHDNILRITDFGTDSAGIAYIVYEAGGPRTLLDLLKEAPIAQERALRVAAQIADALKAAHAAGIAYSSLGPSSILLQHDELGRDTVKLFAGGGEIDLPNSAGSSSPYSAPERLRGQPASAGSDIYSLGVLLYEMLSGARPFEGSNAAELLTKIAAGPPPLTTFRRDLHPSVEPIVMTAIAATPEERYASAELLAEDIRRILGTEKAVAAATGSKGVWKTAAISLVGIAVLASGLIYATYTRQTDPTVQLEADPASLPVQPIGPATGALEDDLARKMPMSDAEILMSTSVDLLPGGDGYNPWANGGAPPPGAPLNSVLPPGAYVQPGQVYTIDPNSGSQFMPNESGIVLVPVPANNVTPAASPTPRTLGDANTQPTPNTVQTPRPLMTPQPRETPAANPVNRGRQPAANTKPPDPESDEN
ncbi:MAG: protein kinase [Acidobacteriota bacterium]|nr:MAG: protein kinase [Acidobacteriota bacterium]